MHTSSVTARFWWVLTLGLLPVLVGGLLMTPLASAQNNPGGFPYCDEVADPNECVPGPGDIVCVDVVHGF